MFRILQTPTQADVSPEVWTLQEFDTIKGEAWGALLLLDGGGNIVRGCTGTRSMLLTLTRILNISPHELPRTTRQEFFLRANPAILTAMDESDVLKRQYSPQRNQKEQPG